MGDTTRRDQLLRYFDALDPRAQQRVLAYVSSFPSCQQDRDAQMDTRLPVGTPGWELVRFAATLAPEDAAEIKAAIEAECERIDHDAW